MAKALLIVSCDLPDDVDEGYAKFQHIADEVRPHFAGQPDVEVRLVIRETADEVLAVLNGGG